MSEISVLLIHGGESHEPSKLALDKISNNNVSDVITKVPILTPEAKDQLKNNTKDLEINEIPCILVIKDGISIVNPIDKLDDIIALLKNLLSIKD